MEIETKALYWRSIKGYSFSFNITRSTSALVFLRFDHSYLSILYLYAACSTISWFYFSIISFRNPSLVRQIIKTQADGFRKRTTNKLNWRNQLQRTKKWPLNNTKQQQQKNKNKKQTDKQNKTKKKTKQILKKDDNKKETNSKKTHTQKNQNINKKK